MSTGRAPKFRSDVVADSPAPSTADVSLVDLVNVVIRHRLHFFIVGFAMALLVVLPGLAKPRQYTSEATFMPQAARRPSPLSEIAAGFGVALAQDDALSSPQFYVDLLRARSILVGVAESPYTQSTAQGEVTRPLSQWLTEPGTPPALRQSESMATLARKTRASVRATGIIDLKVTDEDPRRAQAIGTYLLGQLQEFNLERRQSQARVEREFTEARLADALTSLRQAEQKLQQFLEANRADLAPRLMFQRSRLERELTLRQAVYAALAQNYEQARIDEVRNTEVVTVIDPPTLPLHPNARGTVRRAVIGFLVGSLLALMFVFGRLYVRELWQGRVVAAAN